MVWNYFKTVFSLLLLVVTLAFSLGMEGVFLAYREDTAGNRYVTWGEEQTEYRSFSWPFMARTNEQVFTAQEDVVRDMMAYPLHFSADVLYWIVVAMAVGALPRLVRRFSGKS